MITQEELVQNQTRYVTLLRSITREGANIEGMIRKLESTDFFDAPASTQSHNAFKGGLCQHTLHVRDMLFKFVATAFPEGSPWTDDTLNIVSLCHDLSKMNFYEPYYKNVKVYCENGTKKDNIGKFEWTSEEAFKIKEASDRFMLGSHGQNSEYIAGTYIPLSFEEKEYEVREVNSEALYEIFNKLEFTTFIKKLNLTGTAALKSDFHPAVGEKITDSKQLEQSLADLEEFAFYASDDFTQIGIYSDKKVICVDLDSASSQEILKVIFENDKKKYGMNTKNV